MTALILINVVLFLAGWSWPLHDAGQLVTYGFSHATWVHLALNMLTLWAFGRDVQRWMGHTAFVLFYVLCVIVGGAIELLFGPGTPAVGASAGVYGVTLMWAILNPQRKLMWLPSIWAVALYLTADAVAGLMGWAKGIAHFAHLGGAIVPVLVALSVRRKPV